MQRTLVGPSRAQNEPVRPKNRFHLKFLINKNSKYEIDTHLGFSQNRTKEIVVIHLKEMKLLYLAKNLWQGLNTLLVKNVPC